MSKLYRYLLTNQNFIQVGPVMLLEIVFDGFQLNFRQTWIFPQLHITIRGKNPPSEAILYSYTNPDWDI